MDGFLDRYVLLLFVVISYSSPIDTGFYFRAFIASEARSTKNFGSTYNLTERFQLFEPVNSTAVYTITICADIPDNNNAERVHVGQQPGHVFLILEKVDQAKPGHPVVQVFGFYPVSKRSSLFKGDVSSKLTNNSNNEYNASLSKQVSASQFQVLLKTSEELAARKYNLRRFNCYDYVLAVFNAIPAVEKLPVTHVTLPYLLGRAGSPCGLYRDLKKLKDNQSPWAPYIQLGIFKAPKSSD